MPIEPSFNPKYKNKDGVYDDFTPEQLKYKPSVRCKSQDIPTEPTNKPGVIYVKYRPNGKYSEYDPNKVPKDPDGYDCIPVSVKVVSEYVPPRPGR